MSKADFNARVKKFEVVNQTSGSGFTQSIRVILEDVELSDDNLLELRQFAPDEAVFVVIRSMQPNLFEAAANLNKPKQTKLYQPSGQSTPYLDKDDDVTIDDDENEEFITFSETDGDDIPTGNVVKSFPF